MPSWLERLFVSGERLPSGDWSVELMTGETIVVTADVFRRDFIEPQNAAALDAGLISEAEYKRNLWDA